MRRIIWGILCGVMVSLSSCSIMPDVVVMKDVDVNDWHEAISLEWENNSEQERDLSIMLHVNSLFNAEQIALQIKIYSPDSLYHIEQVVLPCTAELSQTTARAIDVEIPYRRNVSLKHKGKYIVEITPLESIAGVEAAGINFQADK